MAIPDKPLEFLTDPDRIKNREMKLFTTQGFDYYKILAFLAEHTNWTMEELDEIDMGEMREIVAPQLGEALNKKTVPLSS